MHSHGNAEPTKQAYEEFEILQGMATQYLGEWTRIKTSDLSAFNTLVHGRKLPVISVTARVTPDSAADREDATDEDEQDPDE